VQARYEPRRRAQLLHDCNLRLERMRFLFRAARDAKAAEAKGFEKAMRRIDETGRMIHGWRVAIGARPAARSTSAPPSDIPSKAHE
jgi:hypothetical protein